MSLSGAGIGMEVRRSNRTVHIWAELTRTDQAQLLTDESSEAEVGDSVALPLLAAPLETVSIREARAIRLASVASDPFRSDFALEVALGDRRIPQRNLRVYRL